MPIIFPCESPFLLMHLICYHHIHFLNFNRFLWASMIHVQPYSHSKNFVSLMHFFSSSGCFASFFANTRRHRNRLLALQKGSIGELKYLFLQELALMHTCKHRPQNGTKSNAELQGITLTFCHLKSISCFFSSLKHFFCGTYRRKYRRILGIRVISGLCTIGY